MTFAIKKLRITSNSKHEIKLVDLYLKFKDKKKKKQDKKQKQKLSNALSSVIKSDQKLNDGLQIIVFKYLPFKLQGDDVILMEDNFFMHIINSGLLNSKENIIYLGALNENHEANESQVEILKNKFKCELISEKNIENQQIFEAFFNNNYDKNLVERKSELWSSIVKLNTIFANKIVQLKYF